MLNIPMLIARCYVHMKITGASIAFLSNKFLNGTSSVVFKSYLSSLLYRVIFPFSFF